MMTRKENKELDNKEDKNDQELEPGDEVEEYCENCERQTTHTVFFLRSFLFGWRFICSKCFTGRFER